MFGLVLGGGGPRGFAHVGVIEALIEHKLLPSYVMGCSAGAVVAAMYGWGVMSDIARKMAVNDVLEKSFFFRDGGRYKSSKVAEFVAKCVGHRDLDGLRLPVGILTTNLISGEPEVFSKGDAGTFVSASCAVPAIFSPVTINGGIYVDGGISSVLPIAACREHFGVENILAVDISSFSQIRPKIHIWTNLERSMSIMAHTQIQNEIAMSDPYKTMVLSPDVSFMRYDLKNREQAIAVGRRVTVENIDKIRRLACLTTT